MTEAQFQTTVSRLRAYAGAWFSPTQQQELEVLIVEAERLRTAEERLLRRMQENVVE